MKNEIQWGIVTKDDDSFVSLREGSLVRLRRNSHNPFTIWAVETHEGDTWSVETHEGDTKLAAFVYYDLFEFSTEEQKDAYRMLYPNWSHLI